MTTDAGVHTVTDVLGEPYLAETIELPPDDEGEVVATLVSRASGGVTTKAVLHLHGFADYFFQTGYAEWWTDRGYDFYALDLRKYGRSLRPHQTPNYITDLAEYHPEIDAAWQRITERDGHTEVVLSAHSTGGLVVGLWAGDRRPAELAGVVLNSPWLDLQGSALVRAIGAPVIDALGARSPTAVLRAADPGHYARVLHRSLEGEWDYDLDLKLSPGPPIRVGWLRAVVQGQRQVAGGLGIEAPVLVLASARTSFARRWSEDLRVVDTVLDVEQIATRAVRLGRHVTVVRVEEGLHDLVLSAPPVRERVFAEIARFVGAYVPAAPRASGFSRSREKL